MKKKIFIFLVTVLGLLFLFLTYLYWTVPAKSLPSFLPGFEAGISKTHFKHGLGTLILSLGSFVFVWFQTGKKSSK